MVDGVPIRVGRLVGRIDPGSTDAALEDLAETADRAGTELEWELVAVAAEIPALVKRALAANRDALPILSLAPGASPHAVRVLVSALADAGADGAPIALRQRVGGAPGERSLANAGQSVSESALIEAAVSLGSSLCDGIGDLVSLETQGSASAAVDLAYRILQGARLRTTRTEYISCPSCGRTLFDLEETTAKIKQRTVHLSGVKIAVMGCIVNGPGEMADADFGYVGSGVGQVTLYVGKQIVARAVPEAQAHDRLVELIKANGRWVDA